jgi:hypothetical protein
MRVESLWCSASELLRLQKPKWRTIKRVEDISSAIFMSITGEIRFCVHGGVVRS